MTAIPFSWHQESNVIIVWSGTEGRRVAKIYRVSAVMELDLDCYIEARSPEHALRRAEDMAEHFREDEAFGSGDWRLQPDALQVEATGVPRGRNIHRLDNTTEVASGAGEELTEPA
jgi:hypothetical protein